MKKDVLMSFKPRWSQKIINGEKTIEFRVNAPKILCPYTVYIYEAKQQYVKWQKGATTKYGYGSGKVIGSFRCNYQSLLMWDSDIRFSEHMKKENPDFRSGYVESVCKRGCIEFDELKLYANGADVYMMFITDVKIFERPMELYDFLIPTDGKRDCADYNANKHCRDCKYFDFYDCVAPFDVRRFRPLTFTPRNFVYVLEDER